MVSATTITEEQLPETFPELLRRFVERRPKSRKRRQIMDELVRQELTQKYALLAPEALKARRVLPVDINDILIKGGGSKQTIKGVVQKIFRKCFSSDKGLLEKLLDEIPDEMLLGLPLFAYVTNETEWKIKGRVSHDLSYNVPFKLKREKGFDRNGFEEVDVEEALTIGLERSSFSIGLRGSNRDRQWEKLRLRTNQYGVHSGTINGKFTFTHPVDISVESPIAPEEVANLFPGAIADYYQAYANAVQELRLREPEQPSHPKMGVLWLPSADSLQVSAKAPPKPRPIYRDPALVMDVGDKYVVGLWDIENERPIESPLREWTSGSFSRTRKSK